MDKTQSFTILSHVKLQLTSIEPNTDISHISNLEQQIISAFQTCIDPLTEYATVRVKLDGITTAVLRVEACYREDGYQVLFGVVNAQTKVSGASRNVMLCAMLDMCDDVWTHN